MRSANIELLPWLCVMTFLLIYLTVWVTMFTKKKFSLPLKMIERVDLILDTSAIIDGRINNLCKLGILRGSVIVPTFVIGELESILNSDDIQKSIRGMRGKAVLTSLPRNNHLAFEMPRIDYQDLKDVDDKLIRFAKQAKNGIVITCDDGLAQKLKAKALPVLMMNDIMQAVRPLLVPGEVEEILIVEKGKSSGQGIGYLEDGTVVIVEGADERINERILVRAKRIISTKGGNSMVFAIQEVED